MTCGCGGPCCAATVRRILADSVHEDGDGLFAATTTDQSIESATLHVSSARLDGSYLTGLRNTGPLPLLRTTMNSWRATLDGYGLPFADKRQSIGFVWPGATRHFQNAWSVTGILTVLWALLNILLTGSANVTEHVDLQALGYHRTRDIQLRVPIKIQNVKWEWS